MLSKWIMQKAVRGLPWPVACYTAETASKSTCLTLNSQSQHTGHDLSAAQMTAVTSSHMTAKMLIIFSTTLSDT